MKKLTRRQKAKYCLKLLRQGWTMSRCLQHSHADIIRRRPHSSTAICVNLRVLRDMLNTGTLRATSLETDEDFQTQHYEYVKETTQ